MKKILKIMVFSLLVVVFSIVSFAKQNSANKVVEVIRMEGGDFGAPNPFKNSTRGPGKYKTDIIYDSLLERDEKGLIPWLAQKYEVSDDGKKITFDLHSNVKWHDGLSLTAEDIKFSLEYYDKYPPVVDLTHDNGENIIKEIKILGRNKISIVLKKYSPTYLERIGLVKILPKHIWEKVKDPISFEEKGYLIGSGPYKVLSYNQEKGTYSFAAFDDFWGMKPAAKRLEWVPVSNTVLALERGDISVTRVSPDILERYKSNKKYGVIVGDSFHSYRLLWNQKNVKETENKNIRQAMAYAINKENLVKKLERGYGSVTSSGYIPKENPMYNPNIKTYEYSIEKAKELMKGTKINGTLLVSNSPKEIKLAELVKLDLGKIGINLVVKSVDAKSRDRDVKKGNYEFALLKYGGMGGEADFLRKVYMSTEKNGIGTMQGYTNKELDRLLLAQLNERDKKRRKEIFAKAQEIIAEEVPMLPLYSERWIHVYNKEHYANYRHRYDHYVPYFTKLSFLIKE